MNKSVVNTKKNQKVFLDAIWNHFRDNTFRRKELLDFAECRGFINLWWFFNTDEYRVTHGIFKLPENYSSSSSVSMKRSGSVLPNVSDFENSEPVVSHESQKVSQESTKPVVTVLVPAPKSSYLVEPDVQDIHEALIPEVDPLFVKHGDFDLISKIIGSNQFYPIFVTGLSGNGKTFGIEQACATNRRELYRVNITIETDEDDLLGGFRLVNDSTKWFDGPVIRAMKSGGVLLLDEVDLGSNKLLCLQPVLEGKGIFLKKINQFVKPAPGFTVVATANTKGQGSDSGKFIGTNILNEAFLERFCATFEQQYPEERVEKNILNKVFASHSLSGEHIDDFVARLVTWAFGTRKTYESGGTTDLISTRRLVHIANAYSILGHPKVEQKKAIGKVRRQAIQLCIARFDESTKISFLSFYENIDPYLSEDDSSKETPPPSSHEYKTEGEENDIISILTSGSRP